MKIAIDVSRIVNEKAGVGRYTAELIRALLEADKKKFYWLRRQGAPPNVYRKSLTAKLSLFTRCSNGIPSLAPSNDPSITPFHAI